MSYHFRPGWRYLMPTHFGPAPGPRQRPDGGRFTNDQTPVITTYTVRFRTERAAMSALLPPGFEVAPDPLITIEAVYMSKIEWLAGRSYNTLGVYFASLYRGRSGAIEAPLLAVLWENMAEPIITGREELGIAKIYCELPPPRVVADCTSCQAEWDSFAFLQLELTQLSSCKPSELPRHAGEGVLHYKYLPRTGSPGDSDVQQVTYTPFSAAAHGRSDGGPRITESLFGAGRAEFHPATWSQMPTQFHIVNALAALPQVQWLPASKVTIVGNVDLSGQRILEPQ